MTYYLIHQIHESDLEPCEFWTEKQAWIYRNSFFDKLDELLAILANQQGLSMATFRRHVLEIFYCAELRPDGMTADDFDLTIREVIREAIQEAEQAAVAAAEKYAEDNEEEWHRDYHREVWNDESEDCDVCEARGRSNAARQS